MPHSGNRAAHRRDRTPRTTKDVYGVSYLRLQSLPVVVFTGAPDSPMVQHATALKVNSVLVKGKASVDDIRHAVEEAAVRVPV
jgi:DNA-binding NarL/FixJ family response regulator